MKKKMIIFGIILLVAINLSALVTMGYNKWCAHHGRGCEVERRCELGLMYSPRCFLYRHLSLSESQVEEMELLGESFDQKVIPLRAELNEKREQLVKMLMESEPNREEINVKLSEIDSLQAELQKGVINHLLQVKGVLTPEQQENFSSLILERLCPKGIKHGGENCFPMMGDE